jgi:hypothetical protein
MGYLNGILSQSREETETLLGQLTLGYWFCNFSLNWNCFKMYYFLTRNQWLTPSYLGNWDRENQISRPALANSSQDLSPK